MQFNPPDAFSNGSVGIYTVDIYTVSPVLLSQPKNETTNRVMRMGEGGEGNVSSPPTERTTCQRNKIRCTACRGPLTGVFPLRKNWGQRTPLNFKRRNSHVVPEIKDPHLPSGSTQLRSKPGLGSASSLRTLPMSPRSHESRNCFSARRRSSEEEDGWRRRADSLSSKE